MENDNPKSRRRNKNVRATRSVRIGELLAAVAVVALTGVGCADSMADDGTRSTDQNEPKLDDKEGQFPTGGKADTLTTDQLRKRILFIANTYSFEELDEFLHRLSAEGIVSRRTKNGEFQDLHDLDEADYVGRYAYYKLLEEARSLPDGTLDQNDESSSDATKVVTLEAGDAALPALGDSRIWEGWLIVDGEPTSTGHFRADDEKTSYSFEVPADEANNAAKFVLTIEPADEPEGTPSSQKYLAGSFVDGTADISTQNGPTLAGEDLSDVSGQFFLAAPSGRNNPTTDYRNGIWFIDNSGGGTSDDGIADFDDGTRPSTVTLEGELADSLRTLYEKSYEEGLTHSAITCAGSGANTTCDVPVGSVERDNQEDAILDLSSRDDDELATVYYMYRAVDYLGSYNRTQQGHVWNRFRCSNGQSPSPYTESNGYSCEILVDGGRDAQSEKTAGLDLPELGDGWTYEGWVVKPGVGPVSTGRFDAPDQRDSDSGGPFAGEAGTPPFPGQDFVMNDGRRDLTDGYKTVITVEPQPDDSPKPFAVKPLASQIEDAGKGTLQTLTHNGLPEATVTLE